MKFLHAVSHFLLFAVALPLYPLPVTAATALPVVTYTVQVAPVAEGEGKVFQGTEDISAGKAITLAAGKYVSLKMVPALHSQVKEVLVGGESRGAAKSVKVKVVDKNVDVSASFEKIPYAITASKATGGTINVPLGTTGTFGEVKTFTVTPDKLKGYYLVDLKLDGKSIKSSLQGETFSFTVAKKHKLSATFSNTYTIKASAGLGGSISPKGTIKMRFGTSKTFTIKKKTGFFPADVIVDGENVGPVETYTYTQDVWEAAPAIHTINATFDAVRHYPVTAIAESGGTITPSGVFSMAPGETQVFTITPDAGNDIGAVVVDGLSQGSISQYTMAVTDKPRTITASFVIATHTITATADSNAGSIVPAGAVPITHGQSQTFHIAPAAGYRILDVKVGGATPATSLGPVETYTFTGVTGDKTIAATFLPVYTISATASAGGSISPSGAITIDAGQSQAFTVVADPGYVVTDVVVDGVSKGTVSSVAIGPINETGHTVSASFAKTYGITVSSGTGGSISPSGTIAVTEGSSQYFSIKPDAGYRIADVRVDNVSIGAEGAYTFTNVREAGHKIEATFVKTYVITASAPADKGSIGPGTITADGGSSATFTVTSLPGYRVDKVEVDGVDQGALNSYTFTNISADHTITASFIALHTLTVGVEGSGGKIVPPGPVTVSEGGSQSFLVVPDTGYAISKVMADETDLGLVSGHTFTNITSDRSLRAWFTPLSYAIGATAGSGGSITPSGTVSAVHGTSKTFDIAAAAGYHISDVKVDNVSVGPVATYAIDNIVGTHTIHADFVADTPVTYVVSAAVAGAEGGTISPAGITTVTEDGTVTYLIVPNEGYHIAFVTVDGVPIGAVDRYTFTGISANRRIAATFELNAPMMKTIIATAGPGGSISPSGSVTLPEGSTQAFVAVAAAGYHVAAITVDGQPADIAGPIILIAGDNREVIASFAADAPAQYAINVEILGQGDVKPNNPITVSAGSALTLQFIPAEGQRVKGVIVNGVARGAITTYTFTAVNAVQDVAVEFEEVPPATYTISAGAGPGGIVAPPGAKTVANGETPMYTVVPDPGYHVAKVYLDNDEVTLQPDGSYTFAPVHADHVLSVTFAADVIRTYTINASAGDGGTISPTGGITVARGTTRAFTITPATGFRVADVTVDGVSVGPVTSYTFIGVDRDYSIAATFEQLPPATHTITASASMGGTVSPAGSVTVVDGGEQKIAFIANEGYTLTEVIIDGTARPEAITSAIYGEFVFSGVAGDHTASASFTPVAPAKHQITASVGGGEGTITPLGVTEVLAGYNQVYDMVAADGYALIDVLVDGVSQGAVSSFVFMGVDDAHTISAVFARMHNVRVDRNSGGYVSPDGDTSVVHGSPVTFTIVPSEGFVVETVELVRGEAIENIGAVGSYAIAEVAEDVTLKVRFKQQFIIEATAGPGGTISPSGTQAVLLGGTAAYTITPAAGYTVVDVKIDNASRGALTSYTFAANETDKNHTIEATFTKLYSIAASVDGAGGTISPAGTNAVRANSSVTFSFTPSAGYYLREVIVDGEAKGAPSKYTFSAVAADHTIMVRFAKIFTVTATAGTGGTISPAGSLMLPEGSSQAYAITANAGYLVQNVQVQRGGVTEQLGAVTSYTLPAISSDVTISATFIPLLILEATKVGAGTISPAGKTTVFPGWTVTYTIVPDPKNYLLDVVVDGVSKGAVTSFEFANINAPHTIVAYFAAIHTIKATGSAGGTISPSGAISVLSGASQKFVFTPDPNAQVVVKEVKVDGIALTPVPSEYTFTNVTADHTVSVTFGPPQWKKAVVRIATAGSIAPTKIASLMVTLTVPAGVSPAAGDLFLNGAVSLTPLTAGSFTDAVYNQTVPDGGGTITIGIMNLAGFDVGDVVVLNLDIAEGAFPTVGDFSVQIDEVIDEAGLPIGGVSPIVQTTFTN